ncbi:hypothetical protein AB0392_19165 [Nonomuraea angiospora]|uniref:hypothetical protein n=1 Tax=Nonomuraea angiospora TaxID=46172 RepID=UPI00344C10C2
MRSRSLLCVSISRQSIAFTVLPSPHTEAMSGWLNALITVADALAIFSLVACLFAARGELGGADLAPYVPDIGQELLVVSGQLAGLCRQPGLGTERLDQWRALFPGHELVVQVGVRVRPSHRDVT